MFEAGKSTLASSRTLHWDSLQALQILSVSSRHSDSVTHTIVDGQISLSFSHDVVLLLLLHVGAFIVRLVEHELVRTCSTCEGIPAQRILSGLLNSQAIAAVGADCNPLVPSQ